MIEEKALEASKTSLSRRSFLKGTGVAIAGFAAGSVYGLNATKAEAAITLPWPYPAGGLDIDLVKQKAFDGYFAAGCCYGAAVGIVESIKAQLTDSPWEDLPTAMFGWGGGGGLSWGTICGALNGVMPVVNLLAPDKASAFGDALLSWYSTFPFPGTDANLDSYIAANHPDKAGLAIPSSICNSPLCHASVSTWCAISNKSISSLEKKVRCAKLTAETAGKTAELLNDWILNGIPPAGITFDDTTVGCMDCHKGTGTNSAGDPKLDDEQGKMTCGECHADGGKNVTPGCSRPLE